MVSAPTPIVEFTCWVLHVPLKIKSGDLLVNRVACFAVGPSSSLDGPIALWTSWPGF